MAKKVSRKVLGPNGQSMMKTFIVGKSKSVEPLIVKKDAPKLEVALEKDTVINPEIKVLVPADMLDKMVNNETLTSPEVKPMITIPMIEAMEPQELRVVAEELKLKLGNIKNKDKMQAKLIKLLGLEENIL